MRTPHTHTLSFSRWLHTGNKLHFPQHQKIWQKCDSAFCLTLGTLHTSSRPLFNTSSLVFSLQIQGSRQNHMETTSPFFIARGRTRHLYACAVPPPPVAVGTVKIQKLLMVSPHPGKNWVCEAAGD